MIATPDNLAKSYILYDHIPNFTQDEYWSNTLYFPEPLSFEQYTSMVENAKTRWNPEIGEINAKMTEFAGFWKIRFFPKTGKMVFESRFTFAKKTMTFSSPKMALCYLFKLDQLYRTFYFKNCDFLITTCHQKLSQAHPLELITSNEITLIMTKIESVEKVLFQLAKDALADCPSIETELATLIKAHQLDGLTPLENLSEWTKEEMMDQIQKLCYTITKKIGEIAVSTNKKTGFRLFFSASTSELFEWNPTLHHLKWHMKNTDLSEIYQFLLTLKNPTTYKKEYLPFTGESTHKAPPKKTIRDENMKTPSKIKENTMKGTTPILSRPLFKDFNVRQDLLWK